MIVATFLGGPRDGDRIALADATFGYVVPVSGWHVIDEAPWATFNFACVEMMPELTENGWVLRWKEPSD